MAPKHMGIAEDGLLPVQNAGTCVRVRVVQMCARMYMKVCVYLGAYEWIAEWCAKACVPKSVC